MSAGEPLPDDQLPAYFAAADAASARGQRLTVGLSIVRLLGAVAAAFGAELRAVPPAALWSVAVVGGFAVALVSEVVLLVVRPERAWYDGRASAESAKTLAWRFAVRADPFGPGLDDEQARRDMSERLGQADAGAEEGLVVGIDASQVTPAMLRLRAAPFLERRAAYLAGRTRRQHTWYVAKARHNRRWSVAMRACLIGAEVVALVVATVDVVKGTGVDYAGLVAALVAAGAAYLSLKQFEPLAAAYRATARELAVQLRALESVDEEGWSAAVADAEEAISREHTMWLATRQSREV